jgi:hypothetical protein
MPASNLNLLIKSLLYLGEATDDRGEIEALERIAYDLKPLLKDHPGVWDEIWIYFGLRTDTAEGARAEARQNQVKALKIIDRYLP